MKPRTINLLAGAGFGFMLWFGSESLFARAEPWDSDVAWAYLLLLGVGGFTQVGGMGASIVLSFWSIYLGQFLFGLAAMFLGHGSLFPLGAVVLLAWNLPVLAGGLAARALARHGKAAQK